MPKLPSCRHAVVGLALLLPFFQLWMMRPYRSMVPRSSAVFQHNNVESTTSARTESIPQTTPSSPKNSDWFQLQAWLENPFTASCWHVEDICHSAHHWFYNPFSLVPERQPPFSVDLTLFGNPSAGRPGKLVVTAPNRNMTVHGRPIASWINTCSKSPIPNHMVFQGLYNGMLGEFYSRTLPWVYLMQSHFVQKSAMDAASGGGLTQNFTANTSSSSSSSSSLLLQVEVDDQRTNEFWEQSQMYLHVSEDLHNGKLLDSHHLFTEAFRSNPLLSFTSLLDNAGCRCLKRLILCGYSDLSGSGKPVRDLALNTTVATRMALSASSGPADISKSPHYAKGYQGLRAEMRTKLIESNPFILSQIERFRTDAILRVVSDLNRSDFNESEFRIVGLTQRNGRRRWLNLDDLLRRCNTEWFRDKTSKIVCIEVNVEKDEVHAFHQVIIHGACDMMIGIHGAQLTEAIWMKDGSTVIELLPWIIPNGYGLWTRTTCQPTALGEIFHETRLNHIGYPLQRDSSPYCENAANETEYRHCMAFQNWADRNYQVEHELILDMITKFLPNTNTSTFLDAPLSCDEWNHRAGENQYVLYNVYCTDNATTTATSQIPLVHHYYWPKDVNCGGSHLCCQN